MIEYTVKVNEGVTEWFLNGKLHREDGPAMIEKDDEDRDVRKAWYKNGKQHREDGPAVEWSDGGLEWWLNGQLHREDGPAVEYEDGRVEWWFNGEELTEVEFKNRNKSCVGMIVTYYGKDYELVEVKR